MKILALDTATEACSVALLIDGHFITREMEFERGHGEHILPMVDAVLAEAGVTLRSLDALAFGRGPGGFTGVRLAASIAQGLAFGADLKVVPISDLAAMAQRAFDLEPLTARVLVCNDARMNEVYWACFERSPDNLAVLVGEEHVGPPSSVIVGRSLGSPQSPGGSELAGGGRRSPSQGAHAGVTGAIGRGFRAYPELRATLLSEVDGQPPIAHLISDQLLPRSQEIATLAAKELQEGRTLPPEQAIPVYLRDDVARPAPVTKLK
jgi:tRNA threonylcarbamoyladenosine biosynthesis protein TsaB